MPATTVRRHQTLEEIGEAAWEELLARAARASVFQTYAWNACWWAAKQNRRRRLVLLSAWENGELVALAPLFHQESALRRDLCFLGHGNSDYLDFVVAAGREDAAATLLAAAGSLEERWHRFHLLDLPAWSVVRQRLEAAGTPGSLLFRRGDDTACPGLVRLTGEKTFLLATQHKMLRNNSKILARAGRVETVHLSGAAAIQPHLEGFFATHVRRWSSTPYPSLFLDEENRRFYRCLVEHMPVERLLFTVVTLDGRPVAYHFGFVYGGILFFYKPTYDVESRRLSPGSTLLVELFKWCEARGLEEFDFTRGDEAFKERFANHVDHNASYVWYRSRSASWQDALAGRSLRAARRLLRRSR